MDKLIALRQKLGSLVEQARKLVDKADAEKRAMTAEEQTSYDAMFADIGGVETEIKRHEQLVDAERRLAATAGPALRTELASAAERPEGPEAQERRYRTAILPAINAWLRGGVDRMSADEKRALQADLDTSGGYLKAPAQWMAQIIKAADDLMFIAGLASVKTVTSSDSLGAPYLAADPEDATWSSEIGSADEDTAMSFGKRELKVHPLKKLLKVSEKLLLLSADAEALVRERLAYKLALPQEKAFLTGSGSGQPLGVFTAGSNGISTDRDVSTGNSTTAIAADNLIECAFTLKGPYQARAQWVMHRDVLKKIFKLKDGQGQYLWQPGLSSGRPNTILGFPYNMSEHAPNTFTTGLYMAILGDFSYYWIARMNELPIKRLVELYAATSQIGFIVEQHVDGMPVLEDAFVRSKLA